eukprot:UN22790
MSIMVEIWYYADEDMESYTKKFFPQFYNCFRQSPLIIEKTDWLRLFVLYNFGGFWADVDVHPKKRVDQWTISVETNLISSLEYAAH